MRLFKTRNKFRYRSDSIKKCHVFLEIENKIISVHLFNREAASFFHGLRQLVEHLFFGRISR